MTGKRVVVILVSTLVACGASEQTRPPVDHLPAASIAAPTPTVAVDCRAAERAPDSAAHEPTCAWLLYECEDDACAQAREAERDEPTRLSNAQRRRLREVDRAIAAGRFASALQTLESFGAPDTMSSRAQAYFGLASLRRAEELQERGAPPEDIDEVTQDAIGAFESVIATAADRARRARAYYHLAQALEVARGPIVMGTLDDPTFSQAYEFALRASLCLRPNEVVKLALVSALLRYEAHDGDPRSPLARAREANELAIGTEYAGRASARWAEARARAASDVFLRPVELNVRLASPSAYCDEYSEGDCSQDRDEASGLHVLTEAERLVDADGMPNWTSSTYALLPSRGEWVLNPITITDVDPHSVEDAVFPIERLTAPCELVLFGDSSVCRLGDDPTCLTPRGDGRFANGGTISRAASGGLVVTRALDGRSTCVTPASLCLEETTAPSSSPSRPAAAEPDTQHPPSMLERHTFARRFQDADAYCDWVESEGGVRCFVQDVEGFSEEELVAAHVCDVDHLDDHNHVSDDCFIATLIVLAGELAEVPEGPGGHASVDESSRASDPKNASGREAFLRCRV